MFHHQAEVKQMKTTMKKRKSAKCRQQHKRQKKDIPLSKHELQRLIHLQQEDWIIQDMEELMIKMMTEWG